MKIKIAETPSEVEELEQLLWEVLWRPLGMERDAGRSFELDFPRIALIAVAGERVIGGLVAFRLAADKARIRHLAVRPDRQGNSTGHLLMSELLTMLRRDAPVTVDVIVRSTALDFYNKLGFTATGNCPEHPAFARHGLTLHEMCLEVK